MIEDHDNRCDFCGETDSNLTHCHGCGATICYDNCRESWNEEYGLDFCFGCTGQDDFVGFDGVEPEDSEDDNEDDEDEDEEAS